VISPILLKLMLYHFPNPHTQDINLELYVNDVKFYTTVTHPVECRNNPANPTLTKWPNASGNSNSQLRNPPQSFSPTPMTPVKTYYFS
jgi:hypothetical protein